MDIELYKAEHLSQKGSSLQSMIMNKDMPILDLLVRESIQNSLDAQDKSNQSGYVLVDYITGSFDKAELGKELNGVSLKSRSNWSNKYLAVKDTNTTGLTGKHDDKKSNLYKLVFGIMEAQQASGAGGSWGIGKTVYFRVGVGFVIYYSRVKKGDGYQSLLSAAFVEDESKPDSLLPAVKGQKYGIAWWGDRIPGTELVKETRSVTTIKRILRSFEGFEPYKGTETGTTIIIPCIDEDALLSNNQPRREPGQPKPFWLRGIKDYIRVAVQKWYAPRLNNKKYVHGTYLNVRVDGKSISPSEMEPFFKLTQALYKKASLSIAKSAYAANVTFEGAEILCTPIRINTEINPKEAGQVAYMKVSRKLLGMTAPDNRPSPYEYINLIDDDDLGKPIIMYCRKPGMVVSYQTDGRWTAGIPLSSNDDFIIGFFVLNPEPLLQNISSSLSLEDYARKSELADHTSWDDCDLGGIKPFIIAKIRKRVATKIAQSFTDSNEDNSRTEDSGLSSLLGRLLLPPEGFGRRPSPPKLRQGGTSGTHKSIRYRYGVEEYVEGGMILSVHITTVNKSATFGVSVEMDSVHGSINARQWENEVGLDLPFIIKSIRVTINKIDGVKIGQVFSITKENSSFPNYMIGDSLLSSNNEWYGQSFKMSDEEAHMFDLDLLFDIAIRRKDIKPSLSFDF